MQSQATFDLGHLHLLFSLPGILFYQKSSCLCLNVLSQLNLPWKPHFKFQSPPTLLPTFPALFFFIILIVVSHITLQIYFIHCHPQRSFIRAMVFIYFVPCNVPMVCKSAWHVVGTQLIIMRGKWSMYSWHSEMLKGNTYILVSVPARNKWHIQTNLSRI